MVYESYFWRRLIKRDITYLRKKLKLTHKQVKDNLDEHFSYVEIKLMTLAYVGRKLADTKKLPDATLNGVIKLKIYPATGDNKRLFFDFEKEFDLNKPSEARLTIRQICNQMIHSYFLQAVGSSRRAFKHVWFVSDYHRSKGLYSIEIEKFLRIMDSVRLRYVTSIKTFRNKTGEIVSIHK